MYLILFAFTSGPEFRPNNEIIYYGLRIHHQCIRKNLVLRDQESKEDREQHDRSEEENTFDDGEHVLRDPDTGMGAAPDETPSARPKWASLFIPSLPGLLSISYPLYPRVSNPGSPTNGFYRVRLGFDGATDICGQRFADSPMSRQSPSHALRACPLDRASGPRA
jgi:hypothetical protein